MIYSLNGRLIHSEVGACVIECGGVGFLCLISMATQRALPKSGDEISLYTHFNVKEDSMDLFGFKTKSERDCFKMLISVSGVGPKVGLAILSELAPEQVALAVTAGDSKAFTKASGVGAKLASRIVLELTDKVKKMAKAPKISEESFAGNIQTGSNSTAAINALTVLGYTPMQAAGVVANIDGDLPVEEIIRLALREFAKNL